jgi:alpha-D-xyloside xylohydrolase
MIPILFVPSLLQGETHMAFSIKKTCKRIIPSLICGICLLTIDAFPAAVPVQSFVQQSDGVLFTMTTGKMKLKACTKSIIRVTYTPSGTFSSRQSLIVADSFPTPPAWYMDTTATTVGVHVANLQAIVTKTTGAIQFLDASGKVLISENSDTGKITAKATVDTSGYGVRLAFNITANENIYGLGHFQSDSNFGAIKNGAYSTLNRNMNGMTVRMMVANRDKPIPFLTSTNQYGMLWDNYSDTYFSFLGATTRTMSVRSTVSDQIDYYIVYGAELDSVIAGYRRITGPAPLFPKYAYGFWMSRNGGTGATQASFLANFTPFRKNSPTIPVDVVVQDWFSWNGTSNNDGYFNSLIWDPTRFPTPATMIDSVHKMNMHYAVSVWPALGSKTGIYTDFHNRGWTWPLLYSYGNAYIYDAFNPAARNLLWNYMNTGVSPTTGYFNKGVDVWWFDGSEPETGNSVGEAQGTLYNAIIGQTGSTYLGSYARYCCGFSLAHSSGVYTNMRATTSNNKRVCVLTRSVYAGQQRYATISWTGDAQGTWPQYRSEPVWGMNFCAAGVPYWTTDIGAFYVNIGSGQVSNAQFRENFTRWFQFGTFLPIFRVHGDSYGGGLHREMWYFQQYDATDSTFSAQLKFDKLRYRLLPYIYTLAWKVTSEGYTILRTLAFDFRTDATVLSANPNTGTEFMFGPSMLVCPVTAQGATSRTVYLPGSGTTWYDFWTGTQLAGNQTVTASAPMTIIPLYVRAGTILPMGPNLQYAMQKQPDTIALRIYRGANGQFTLYEDEGDNYNYESGAFATIPITYNEASKTVTIGQRSGNFTGMLQTRTFKIVWVRSGHGTALDSSVAIAPADSDRYVTYNGVAMSVPLVGSVSIQNGIAPKSSSVSHLSMRTASLMIVFPHDLSGRKKLVEIYDLRGNLIQKVITDAASIDLRKNFVKSPGMHIVDIKVIH